MNRYQIIFYKRKPITIEQENSKDVRVDSHIHLYLDASEMMQALDKATEALTQEYGSEAHHTYELTNITRVD